MDKRDPVVMQAIANVIGAQTIDMGCLGPSPGIGKPSTMRSDALIERG